MARQQRKKPRWSDSLLDDNWTNEPKVELSRHEPNRKPQYLGTYLVDLIDQSTVAAIYGGGEYSLKIVYRGRVVAKRLWVIEGNPIRPPWLET